MERNLGLRARATVASAEQGSNSKLVGEKEEERLKSQNSFYGTLVRLLGMKNRGKTSQLALLACLALTTTLSWLYLTRAGDPVEEWRYGAAWHEEMAGRVRAKMEREELHQLEEEEAHWVAHVGLSIQTEKVAERTSMLPPGEPLHITVSMPFLDHQPLAAAHYITMLEWITIYSSVKLHFHVITNQESRQFVERIMEKVNFTSNCNYDYDFLYFDHIIDLTHLSLCSELAQTEEYCDLLIGKLTPLLFPFLFPHLPYVVYIDKHITFHDDVGHIYNEFLKFDEEEAIGMVQEQSLRYMRSFGTYHMKSPSTSLGRPPSKGKPGFNPDLMVMDLIKLRNNPQYKSLIHELKISLAMRKYSFHPSESLPDLGDVLNLIAAESPTMFYQLSCEWNKSAQKPIDQLSSEFINCLPDETTTEVKATNSNPNLRK